MNTFSIKKFFPYLIVSLGVFYGIWPIDLIPDVPIIGWVDDLGVMGATLLIAYIMYSKDRKKGAE
jgi:uncharacterized membrane protein YkvA (DUF1232 family)